MLQLASFEWGLKQKELLEILNKRKDSNKGKGIRWALKQLSDRNLIETKKTEGRTIHIKNTPYGEFEKAIIGNIPSYAERICYKHKPAKNAPLEYYFSIVEKKLPEVEKEALQEIKLRILQFHSPLIELYSLNPTFEQKQPPTLDNIENKIKQLQIENEKTIDPVEKQKLEKEIQIQQLDLNYLNSLVNQANNTLIEYFEKEKEENKDLLKRQREDNFTYSDWLITELEGIILIDIYNKLISSKGALYKQEGKDLIPLTIEDKVHIRAIMEVCIGLILELDKNKERDPLLAWLKNGVRNLLNIPYDQQELNLQKELIKQEQEAKKKAQEFEKRRNEILNENKN